MTSLKNNENEIFWQGPGGDEVKILKVEIHEKISDLFLIRVEATSENKELTYEDMIHATGKIKYNCGENLAGERFFSGIITGFAQARTRHGDVDASTIKEYKYLIEIRPDLWLSTKKTSSKVFQDKNSKDIVSECLDELGIKHAWNLQATPPTRDYCLQYEETSYNFISRLCQEDGICFFFDHKKQEVVFANYPGGHPDCAPIATARYHELEEMQQTVGSADAEHVFHFAYQEQVSTGLFSLTDYNSETSQTNLMENETDSSKPFFSSYENYEHSLNYKNSGNIGFYKPLRKEAEESANKFGYGESACRSFEVGYCFTMERHFRDEFNAKWMLTELHITMEQGHYHNRFRCYPVKLKYRPERKNKAPKVYGLQAATVTGPAGAEVYLDDLGRCKIQFHWDREGPKNDRSSIWLRVSNGYAGKDYGIQWIPRIGHEVLVAFMDGNVDHPIVVGRVYNDFNACPLKPANKWQNIIKTIKDNHIMFDDEDGKELIDIRAQKNMNTLVLNDKTITVNHNMTTTVHNDKMILVDNNMDTLVYNDKSIFVDNWSYETVMKSKMVGVIEEDYSEYTGRDKFVTIENEHWVDVLNGDETQTIYSGDRTHNINTGDDILNVLTGDRKVTVNAGDAKLEVKTGDNIIDVNTGDMNATAKTGDINIKANSKDVNVGAGDSMKLTATKHIDMVGNKQVYVSGDKIQIIANKELTLGVGVNNITIKSSGIEVGGVKISSAAIGVHEISGALIKIN
ncbi:type VI secretion system tip protein TssI/VgrG [Acanthopleuribacter pedis]|uniref:Type VI secretion system tip protein VgrG n=1 Tax=Acanthopleuribacter pedis TaxID=442870 RepID=A0A8J7U872_9BACT|nr:type VI secretion system tip protein VgrG [Acanthopleuribacter pedis]